MIPLVDRILRLRDDASFIKVPMLEAVRALETAGFVSGCIVGVSRISEGLVRKLYGDVGTRLPSDIFEKQISDLQQRGVLPGEIASCLHTIRIYGNKSRHGSEQIVLKPDDAQNVVLLFLRVAEWYFCEFGSGPKLPVLYAAPEAARFDPLASVNLNPEIVPIYQIRVAEGPDAGKAVPLTRTRMTVGRSADVDVCLSEMRASRNHFSLNWVPHRRTFAFVDHGCLNPVIWNDKLIVRGQEPTLCPGDRLVLGGTTMIYEFVTERSTPAAPSAFVFDDL